VTATKYCRVLIGNFDSPFGSRVDDLADGGGNEPTNLSDIKDQFPINKFWIAIVARNSTLGFTKSHDSGYLTGKYDSASLEIERRHSTILTHFDGKLITQHTLSTITMN
jgi:hypothetical protein